MVIKKYKQIDFGNHDMEEWNRKISEVRNIYLAEINWNFEKTFMVSVAITAMQQLTEFLRSVPAEVAANSDVYIQTLADIIIMISPISPAFSMELWEGLRSKVTSCKNCDMNKPVQDQTWPCLDKDSTMIFVVKCNGSSVYEICIPYVKLNNLTTEEAINYSQGHSVYQEHFQGHNVRKVSLHVQPDYKASLSYMIPSIETSVLKMLNKQMKKSKK